MNNEKVRKYELMVIFSGDLLEADFEKKLEELRGLLKENGKEVFHEESWGKRDLAYRVKKQKRGYYAIFDFTAGPQAIAELRANIKLDQTVLRHMLLTLPENYAPEDYKKLVILEEEPRAERKAAKKEEAPVAPSAAEVTEAKEEKSEEAKKPTVAGKEEEEQLKTVEKKLEKILANPDIDIR